jgi:8-oxo-dGTP diphosphatase
VKTIIRVSPHAIDTADAMASAQIPMLAVRMLAESHGKRRAELAGSAQLVVDTSDKNQPIYITIGDKPPEILIGGRRTFGVFAPPESQDPVATFLDRNDAISWASGVWPDAHAISEIDSGDRQTVRVAVAVLVIKDGQVLLGRLRSSGAYVLPEGTLEVGESLENAAMRAAKSAGIEIGKIRVSKTAPFVSTFLDTARQHFVTLCMLAEHTGGEPSAVDPNWDQCGWFSADTPPEPLFVTVKQIIYLAKKSSEPLVEVSVPQAPPNLVLAAKKARAQAQKNHRQKMRSKPARRRGRG